MTRDKSGAANMADITSPSKQASRSGGFDLARLLLELSLIHI